MRAIPRELANLPEVKWGLRGLAALLGLFLLVLPGVLSDGNTNLAAAVFIYAIIAVSLVMLTGWAGEISLGQMAFVGIGACASRSRRSLLRAESPRSPDRPVSQRSTSATGADSARDRCPTMLGSMSPDLVPITSPSSGVSPIDVSIERPFSIAAAEQPLPRCKATIVARDVGRPVKAQ